MKFTKRRVVTGVGMAAVAGLALTGCSAGGGGDESEGGYFEGRQVEIIVPSSAGGGFDTTARQIQPFLETALGATVVVRNLEGGNHVIGVRAGLEREQNCETIIFEGLPHLTVSYMGEGQDAGYDLTDLAPLVGVSIEPGVLRVRNDAPWQTIEEFIEDAKANPGQISVSVSDPASNNFYGMQQLQEATGAEFNVVPYDGGGPSRTALIAGEVDATHAGVFNSQSIADDTRVIGVQYSENRWGDVTDDAPTFADALGLEVPNNFSNYMTIVPEGCRADFPERYEEMVDGLNTALGDPEFIALLEELGEASKLDVLQPDELEQLMHDTEEQYEALLAN